MTAKILLATAAAALTAGGVATAAEAPVVGPQKTSPAKVAPLTIPGTGVHKGDTLPKGAKLVYRDVTMAKGQKPELTITAPAGTKLRGLVPDDTKPVAFVVIGKGSYVGKTTVKVRAYLAPKTGEGTGRLYALVR